MKFEEIKGIAVLGAGVMGHGIAQVCASIYDVKLYDVDKTILENAILKIKNNLNKLVEKGKINKDDLENIMNRIHLTNDLKEAVKNVEVIIEAIPEDLNLKRRLFSEIDGIAKSDAIFATNTSSLSVTELASATKREDKFIGMHWFNPPPVMKLVEIIKGEKTSDETVEIIKKLVKKLDKEYVVVKDVPGFIVNRILVPMINEAIKVVEAGIASPEEIDKAMTLGANLPMGPLRLADFVGLDTLLKVLENFREELGDYYKPSPLLKRLVKAGKLGIKSGEGFYKYQR